MPATKHGRPGQIGRPSDPVGALRDLGDYAIAPEMRALIRKAADAGFSLKSLAGAAGIRYQESLSRSILSETPRAETIRKLAKALYPRNAAVVARALLGDVKGYECRATLLRILDREGKRVFGEAEHQVLIQDDSKGPPRLESRRVDWNPYLASNNVVHWLEHDAPPEALHEAARVVVLAKYGLNDAIEESRTQDPILGPVLGALERVLVKYKLGSLHDFVRDDQHERMFQLEARALFRGLLYLLPFTEEEEQTVRKIIEPKLSKALTLGPAAQRFERAIDAMHYGFWEAWDSSSDDRLHEESASDQFGIPDATKENH